MGNEAGCKKADLKCGAVVKDSWIIRYSPKIDLYGVWKTENTDDLTDLTRQTLIRQELIQQTLIRKLRGLTGRSETGFQRSRSGKTERSG